MISVVITTHKLMHKYLPRCLNSILWQLQPTDEVIVVGDGYKCDVVGGGPRVQFVTSHRSGVSAGRNIAIQRASHDWIKFIDVDDLLAPFALNAFRRIHETIPHKTAVIVGQRIVVHNGIVIGIDNVRSPEEIIRSQNPCCVSATFVRRKSSIEVEMFDEKIHFEEDYDFWLRLYTRGWKFSTINVPLCCYWISDLERKEKEQHRTHLVDGIDVREFLSKKYL